MGKKFDYEKRVSGVKEKASFGLIELGTPEHIPLEFKDVSGRVLDVGCGAGSFTAKLSREKPELEVYGIDISKKAIGIAKKDFPNIHFLVADAYQLPFPDNFFDVVVMKCVLEHLDNPSKALAEVRKVLKPKGLFWSMTPLEGDRCVLSPPQRLTKKYHGHLQMFSRSSLLSLLESSGFKVKRYYFHGFLLCQVIGVVYHFLLDLLKLPPAFSVKSYITHDDYKPGKWLLSLLRKAVSFLINFESFLIPKRVPGLFMHIVARKM